MQLQLTFEESSQMPSKLPFVHDRPIPVQPQSVGFRVAIPNAIHLCYWTENGLVHDHQLATNIRQWNWLEPIHG
jgi:hypothetical protein